MTRGPDAMPARRRTAAGSARQDRGPLDRRATATAALKIIDEQGVDALTMRRLAAEFSVTPMSLYWHFADKQALLNAVGDLVGEEIRTARLRSPHAASEDPWEVIREFVSIPVSVLVEHHQDITTMLGNQFAQAGDLTESDEALANYDKILGALDDLGLHGTEAVQWVHLLVQSVFMLATASRADTVPETGRPRSAEDRMRAQWRDLDSAAAGRFSHVADAARTMAEDADSTSLLDRGVELTLLALRARLR